MAGNSSKQFCSPNGGIGALRGGRELVAGVANVLDQCLDSLPKSQNPAATQKGAAIQNPGATNHKAQFPDTQRPYIAPNSAATAAVNTHNPMYFPPSGVPDQTARNSNGHNPSAHNTSIPSPRAYSGSGGHVTGAYNPGAFFNPNAYDSGTRSAAMPYVPTANQAGYFVNGYNPGAFNARPYGHPVCNQIPVNPCAYNMAGYNPGQAYHPGASCGSSGMFHHGG